MKKIVIVLAFLLLLYFPSFAFADHIDQQDTGTTNNVGTIGDVGNQEVDECQSFQLSNTLVVTKAALSFGTNVGSPSGSITLKIVTDSSSQASSTLADANASVAATPTENTKVYFNFATPFSLAGATTFWIRADMPAQATNNYYTLKGSTSGGYANGFHGYYYDDTTWNAEPGRDLAFEIWVQDVATKQSKAIFFNFPR